jgi:hypothetical protein
MWKYWKWNKIHCDVDGRCANFSCEHVYLVYYYRRWNMNFFSKRLILRSLYIYDQYMCRIDKYTFYLDFKGVLSSSHQVSVSIIRFFPIISHLFVFFWVPCRLRNGVFGDWPFRALSCALSCFCLVSASTFWLSWLVYLCYLK